MQSREQLVGDRAHALRRVLLPQRLLDAVEAGPRSPCLTSLTRASISGSRLPKLSATGSIVSYGARAAANCRLAAATSPALTAATNGRTRLTSSYRLRVDVAAVAGRPRPGAAGRCGPATRLAADVHDAGRGGRAARAAERVLARLQRERERAGEAGDEVLLLAEDARALQHLELADAAGAGVRDLEGRAAGVELERRGRAAGVGELDLDLLRAAGVVAGRSTPQAGERQHEQEQQRRRARRCARTRRRAAPRPQHVERGGDEVERGSRSPRLRRLRLPAEHPGQQRRRPRAGDHEPA